MNNFYVYMYLRSKNSKHGKAGTPYYVGKGTKMRAYSKDHRVRPPVDKTMIVFVAQNLSENAAHDEEKRLIVLYGRIDKETGCLRNLTDGGEGQCGAKWSAEVIEKRASKMRGRTRPAFTEEWKRKLSESHKGLVSPHKGKKCSPTTCQKISDAKRGRTLSEEQREKVSAGLMGHAVSMETREKIASTLRGKSRPSWGHHTDETRARMSIAAIKREAAKENKKFSPEHKAKITAGLKSFYDRTILSEMLFKMTSMRKDGISKRGIASALHVDRKMVDRYLIFSER